MQHLTPEELARLVDEAPEPHEAAHVRDCLVCRRELDELREMTAALGAMDDPAPDPRAWDGLEARLLREGLLRAPAPAYATRFGSPLLRAAAAVAIFLLGGAAGVALWSRGPTGQLAGGAESGSLPTETVRGPAVDPGAGPQLVATGAATEPGTVPVDPGGETVIYVEEIPAPIVSTPGARLASGGSAAAPARTGGARVIYGGPARPVETGTAPQASQTERELARAEADYVAALGRYAELAAARGDADPVARIAALERLVASTRAAVDRAPDDPVINGYHLAATRELDAVRRQVARASEETWF